MNRRFAAGLGSLLLLASVWAQVAPAPAPRVTVRDGNFQSASLGRSMKYRILLPAGYDSSARRYPVLYLLHGLMGSYVDWESKTHLDDYAAPLSLIVVMPDADDSWYSNSVGNPQERFEDYIAKDLISEIDKIYRTIATRHGRAIAGLSMGGYGAMKFALKYPGLFVFAASFSGAEVVVHDPGYKIRFGPKYDEQIVSIFGGGMTAARSENDVFALAGKINPQQAPFLYVTCGTEDGLFTSNREFAALLHEQKLRYGYRESPGAHTWDYWDEQLESMLQVLARYMEIAPLGEHPPAVHRPPTRGPRQPARPPQ